MTDPCEPAADCPLCPRLVAYRAANRQAEPHWHNGAVASFGDAAARLIVVGLAPGRGGANRTGRPFTGDYAGDLLYRTLLAYGFARGTYGAEPEDGLKLVDCMITNAVRCVPPGNKPLPAEVAACRPFLAARMAGLARLSVVLALGRVAHDQVLAARSVRKAAYAFGHGARHELPGGLVLFDSYHCSRYNTNTGRLTEAMFSAVFAAIVRELRVAPGTVNAG
ncbi:MAG: uracil-DNA glycosylase [Hyphomicrobiaceae bacterium]|nr:uracil-DNA glycosylase [Hyphomicrobiaceae bacterium]